MLGPDGTHYTAPGSDRLAEAVADCVLRQVTVRRYHPLPRPASGAEAAAAYQRAQRGRDAQVPEAYRRLDIDEFRVPGDSATWKEQRPAVLRAVLESLGDLPPRPAPPRVRVVSRELRRRVEDTELPEEVLDELSAAQERLVGGATVQAVAVRSSATTEDAAEESFAGLQDTYLWVKGAEIMRRAQQYDGYQLTIDLERQTIEDEHGLSILFVVGEFQRYCLLEGLDDIGLTLRHEDLIRAYEVSHG